MSLTILVKKQTAAARFHPHYNRSTERYYGTKQEYLADLKQRGLEPYRPDRVTAPAKQQYRPSSWARDMVETIHQSKQTDGSVRLGDRFVDSLAARSGLTPAVYRKRQCQAQECLQQEQR